MNFLRTLKVLSKHRRRLGQRARCSVPCNRGKNTTLLESMSVEGMGPTLAVEGTANREVFEAYIEWVLAPTLRPSQVMVMDNLCAHMPQEVAQAQGRLDSIYGT